MTQPRSLAAGKLASHLLYRVNLSELPVPLRRSGIVWPIICHKLFRLPLAVRMTSRTEVLRYRAGSISQLWLLYRQYRYQGFR